MRGAKRARDFWGCCTQNKGSEGCTGRDTHRRFFWMCFTQSTKETIGIRRAKRAGILWRRFTGDTKETKGIRCAKRAGKLWVRFTQNTKEIEGHTSREAHQEFRSRLTRIKGNKSNTAREAPREMFGAFYSKHKGKRM